MKITLHTFASDDDNGTQADVFGTEVEAEDALLNAVGQDREEFEAWLAAEERGPDDNIFDFASEHSDFLDTYNLDVVTVENVDLCAQPLPDNGIAQAREAVEHLRRARDLLKASGNQQSLARVRLALSSAKGAVRIQSGRETRRLEGIRAEGALAQRMGTPRDGNPYSPYGRPQQKDTHVAWHEGWDREAAKPNPYRRSNIYVSGFCGEGDGFGRGLAAVEDQNADAFGVFQRDTGAAVEFFSNRAEADDYLEAIAVEG